MKVVIMVGASGSGKTTWIKENLPEATVVSTDLYWERTQKPFNPHELSKAHAWAIRDLIMQCAMQASMVVVDNTNTTIAELSPYLAIANAYDAEAGIIWMGIDDIKELSRRNIHRAKEHTIRRHIDNMAAMRLSWPYYWPTPEVIYE